MSETKATMAEQPVTKAPQKTISYPRVESKKIKLVRKQLNTVLPEEGTPYNTAMDYSVFVGGAFAGHNNPLPLGRVIWDTPAEEARIMGLVLAASANHPEWNTMLNSYWQNYRVFVPYEGLELEIGMTYNSEDDPGTPIRVTDYVLYRYCLKYNRVANKPEDANKSPKIVLVLVSQEEEVARATKSIDLKDRATLLRIETLRDDNKARAVLSIMGENPEVNEVTMKLTLARLSDSKPEQFIRAAEDPDLLDKAFIEAAIRYGLLRRPENSDIIILNDTNPLGTMADAVAYFRDPSGAAARSEISAKLAQLRKG